MLYWYTQVIQGISITYTASHVYTQNHYTAYTCICTWYIEKTLYANFYTVTGKMAPRKRLWQTQKVNAFNMTINHKKVSIFANCRQSTSKNRPSTCVNCVQDGEKLQQITPKFEHI